MTFKSFQSAGDAVVPSKITHECEEAPGPNNKQKYNCIRYEFVTERHYYWARFYLNAAHEVSIFGPFDKTDRSVCHWDQNIDGDIVDFFRRRFPAINRLTKQGYETISSDPASVQSRK